jgi:hypothetical protein
MGIGIKPPEAIMLNMQTFSEHDTSKDGQIHALKVEIIRLMGSNKNCLVMLN